ncbi:hypothetical protein ABZ249_08555 [Nocardiopsis sp. NPDC006139]|uniref:hypothetical protein n=1 Tax=unclassified Nocardiopsis TaxID=2649073 RepID=UPI0033B5BD26
MSYPPGWYPDGNGYKRFWDGEQWRSEVSTGQGFRWRDETVHKPSGPPRSAFERDGVKPAPTIHTRWDSDTNAAGGGCFAVVILFVVTVVVLREAVVALRWPLLVLCAVLAVAVAVAFLRKTELRRSRVLLAGVAACLVAGVAARWGFALHEEARDPDPWEVGELREQLAGIGSGSANPCGHMPEEEWQGLAEHYGGSTCGDTFIEIGDAMSSDTFDDVPMTVVGEEWITGEDGFRERRVTVELGENELGWRWLEAVGEHPHADLYAIRFE